MAVHAGRLSRLCATAFALVLSLAALGTAQTAQAAHASSSAANRIELRPDSGTVGAQIDAIVTLYTAPSGQQLRLTAAPWGTTSGCVGSTPIPGVAPFDLPQPLPAVKTIQFNWPAELAHGQFVICALATVDNSVVAASFAPFTVDDGTITPTPTLPPERYPTPASAPTANILGQTDAVTPGSDIAIKIAHWFSSISGGHGTIRVGLLSADVAVDGQQALTATTLTDFTGTSQPPDGLVLTLTLPPATTPGSYRVVIIENGALVAATQPFTVVSAATVGPPLGSQGHGYPPGFTPVSSGPTPLTLLVAGMLALAVLLLAGPALARRLRR